MNQSVIHALGLSLILSASVASAAQCPPLSINGGHPGGVDYTTLIYADFFDIAPAKPHRGFSAKGISSTIIGQHCSYVVKYDMSFVPNVNHADAVTGELQMLLQNPPTTPDSAFLNMDESKTREVSCQYHHLPKWQYQCNINFYVK